MLFKKNSFIFYYFDLILIANEHYAIEMYYNNDFVITREERAAIVENTELSQNTFLDKRYCNEKHGDFTQCSLRQSLL